MYEYAKEEYTGKKNRSSKAAFQTYFFF